MTFKHNNITATILPGGNVRLATQHDTLLIERADLDDAIMALCEVRRLQDREGYLKLIDERLYPYDAPIEGGYTATETLRIMNAINGGMTRTVSDVLAYRDVAMGRYTATQGETFHDGEMTDIRIAHDPHAEPPPPGGWQRLVPEPGAIKPSPFQRMGRAVLAESTDPLLIGKRSPFDVHIDVECHYTDSLAVEFMQRTDDAVDALIAHGVSVDRLLRWTERDSRDVGLMVDCPFGCDDVTPYMACTLSVHDGRVVTTWHPPYEGLGK